MTDARDKLSPSIRQWLEQFAKSYNPKGYTDAAILTGEALFTHLTSQSVPFDEHLPESYCREHGVSEYSTEGINFVKGARWQNAQMAAQVQALRARGDEILDSANRWAARAADAEKEIERLRAELAEARECKHPGCCCVCGHQGKCPEDGPSIIEGVTE